ncbi:MAG: hypothetical protein C0631_12745 [Sedimenticola sp.]|nr:MAG: hypothetical protein C0631_12745 [Sedimenticola sp.]
MTMQIEEIPPIPDGLRDAAQRGTLIPFVGAGASRLAKCPSWNELADGVLQQLIEAGKFSHGQLDQIRNQPPRVKLSIARHLAEEHDFRIDYQTVLHPGSGLNDPVGQRLYTSLSKLGRTFVTTNYDRWLDAKVIVPGATMRGASGQSDTSVSDQQRRVLYKIEDFTYANLNMPDTVIHLHGSLDEPDGMILTTQDYVRHYANDRFATSAEEENLVLTFLDNLFNKEKTVLFLGYGLEELEILEYVILKARHTSGPAQCEARHYILQGFFSHEYELMRGLTRYYLSECGIQLLPFLRDQNDRMQLLNVLEHYAEHMPASELMYLQEFREMEGLLDG